MQTSFYENLKYEIDSLNGGFELSAMQDKISKFLLGDYISIDMALELKEYAALKCDPNFKQEPSILDLQSQIISLTIDALFN